MGRLWVAAVECNYQEVNRQHKEQIIHGLNDKSMIEEIIKELTTEKIDDHITCGGVLTWAKSVEAQRAQVAVLNTITKYPEKSRKAEQKYQCTRAAHHDNHADTLVGHTHQDNAQHMARCAQRATKLDLSAECAKVGKAG